MSLFLSRCRSRLPCSHFKQSWSSATTAPCRAGTTCSTPQVLHRSGFSCIICLVLQKRSRLRSAAGSRNPDVPMHMLLPDGKFAIGVDRQLQELQEQEQQQGGRVVVWADPLRPNHPQRVRANSLFRLFLLANIPITFIIEITATVPPLPPSLHPSYRSPPCHSCVPHQVQLNSLADRYCASSYCRKPPVTQCTGAKFSSFFRPFPLEASAF